MAFLIFIPLSTLSIEVSKNFGTRVVKFKEQVMVADNCYYVDNNGRRQSFTLSDHLKRIHFIGPRSQEFILESSGSGDIKFYSLHIRRNGQQLMVFNDFVSLGQQDDFDNRKVGWIIDLNKDGIFDILQRDKLQIHGKLKNKNSNSVGANRATASVPERIYKSDIINFRLWDKTTKSYLETPFYSSKQKNKYYQEFDFKYNWRD